MHVGLHHTVETKALLQTCLLWASMRGMTQATTNTIRMNLVPHLQACMAVCAGSLQTLDLSVSLCYRFSKLRGFKKTQDWLLDMVHDENARCQGTIATLTEDLSRRENFYRGHVDRLEELLRSRKEDAVSYMNGVQEERRQCEEIHQSKVKALEERCSTAEQELQAEVYKAAGALC